MTVLKEIIAVICFFLAILLAFDLIANEFSWKYCIGCLLLFIFSYLIWPSKRRGKREDDYVFLDMLEFFIEIPMEIIFWIFRIVARIGSFMLGGKGNSSDIDFDL